MSTQEEMEHLNHLLTQLQRVTAVVTGGNANEIIVLPTNEESNWTPRSC